ncbi:MAG: hypothetical protein ACKN9E_00045 [Microcystaceae cyanobacterium]
MARIETPSNRSISPVVRIQSFLTASSKARWWDNGSGLVVIAAIA